MYIILIIIGIIVGYTLRAAIVAYRNHKAEQKRLAEERKKPEPEYVPDKPVVELFEALVVNGLNVSDEVIEGTVAGVTFKLLFKEYETEDFYEYTGTTRSYKYTDWELDQSCEHEFKWMTIREFNWIAAKIIDWDNQQNKAAEQAKRQEWIDKLC